MKHINQIIIALATVGLIFMGTSAFATSTGAVNKTSTAVSSQKNVNCASCW
jgi:hypothetical protein